MPAFGHVEAEGIGERVDDGDRRVMVAALLDPDQILDADAGPRRELRAPQAGNPAPVAGGQAERLGSGRIPSRTQEVSERRAHLLVGTPVDDRFFLPRLALRGPASARSGSRARAHGQWEP
jgi:hypothetical protein